MFTKEGKSMSKNAKCVLDKDYIVGTVDPRLYGSFIEHLGRAVYTGIYEPGHPAADEQGFRKDVLEMVRQLQVPIVRYPGGNFVSGYNWTDGIGPVSERPQRLEMAWLSRETNEVGIDEFVDWSKKAGADVMAAVNLGTGTPQDAGYMVEYCNHESGTYWSDLRRKNGYQNPHDIKLWCLGNEMDGPWQICNMSAEDYGKKAREAAKIMKWVDSDIELVACGSSGAEMPTFPEWDRIVLEHMYEYVDYISLHRYYEYKGDVGDFLASHADMDRFIKTIISTADYVKALKRSKKTINLSFDEWNIWYIQNGTKPDIPWQKAPKLIEDEYTLLDALTLGGLLCTLINNSDRVKVACLAQLVNVIAPILTEKGGRAIKQTTFYPFQQVSTYGRGEVLKPLITCPKFETITYGEMPVLQSAATYNREDGTISVFILNCDMLDSIEVQFDFRSFGKVVQVEHIVLDGSDIFITNTFKRPHNVIPRNVEMSSQQSGTMSAVLPKLSWNVIRYKCVQKE